MKLLDRDVTVGRSLRPGAAMTAAVIAAPSTLRIVQAEVPCPGPTQLLVRLEGCGVCASNVPPWQGRPWFSYPFAPGALGHEGWGRVVQVGSEVPDFGPGDRVAMISNNAFAQFDVANASSVVRLPVQLNDQPFPGEPLGCVMNILRRCEIGKNDTVAVVGIGFLGALLCQLAATVGARVIALGRREFALRFAADMGANALVRMDNHVRVIEEVRELTKGRFCQLVIEATGKQWPLDLAAELTAERGRLVIAGYHQDGPRQVNMQLWNWRGLDVINAHERDPAVYRDGMEQAVRAVAAGLLNPAPLYTHCFRLTELARALSLTAERPDGFMKALIDLT